MKKTSGTSLKLFFFRFVFSFQEARAHNMLCMMLNLHYKTLGLIIRYVVHDVKPSLQDLGSHHSVY